jgi:hypothetical protein
LTIAIIYDKKSEKIITENYMEIDLSDLESYKNFRHGIDFIKFPSQKVEGKTIMEWFAVNDISYWWFAAPILHPKYNDAILFINRFLSFLEKKSIHKIKLNGLFDKVELIKQITKKKNIQLEISQDYKKYLLKNSIKKIVKKKFHKNIFDKKIKKRNNIFHKITKYQKPIKNSILITSPGIYRRQIFDYKTNKQKNDEFFIKPFLELIDKHNIPEICFDLDYTLKGTTKSLEERLKSIHNWIPIEILLKEEKSKIVKDEISKLKKSINELLKKDLDNYLIYKDISLTKYLNDSFQDLFLEPNLPTYIHLVHKLEEYLKEIHPKVIVQVYETGTYAKVFEIVGKKLGIKTMGIQHGLIPTDYPDYLFKEIRDKKNPLGNPIPDVTLVFGEYYKKILTEIGRYPKEKIVIFGNSTYFNFEKIKQMLDKKTILEKNNLENKKIILFPLSMRFYYFGNSPDRILLDALFQNLKNKDDVIVLIRPHPGDKFDQETLSKFYPSKNFIISKNSLFEDIFVTDMVVILPISSVSSEVPIFEKPLILVNIEKDKSIKSIDDAYLQLVEHEVAKLIPLSELSNTINTINKNEVWKIADSEKRKKYLQSYFNYGNSIDLMELIDK